MLDRRYNMPSPIKSYVSNHRDQHPALVIRFSSEYGRAIKKGGRVSGYVTFN